jgi:hypothetical protein
VSNLAWSRVEQRTEPSRSGDTGSGKQHAKEEVRDSTAVRVAARAGLVARGILYILVAILAIRIAFGDRNEHADKAGALVLVARQPFGKALLGVLAAGLAAYAVWMIARMIIVRDDEAAKAWGKRAGYAGRAVLYGVICASAIDTIRRASSAQQQAGNQQEQGWTARVMGWPFGRALVVVAGLVIIATGARYLYKAFTKKWRKKLDLSSASHATRETIEKIAFAGWTGRGVVFGLVGVFLIRAAWQFDPKEAVGADGALRRLADRAWGPWLLCLVALGVLAFGVYSMIEARYRRVTDD